MDAASVTVFVTVACFSKAFNYTGCNFQLSNFLSYLKTKD